MTSYVSFVPGIRVRHAGREYTITHILDLESVLAADKESGDSKRLLIKELSLPITTTSDGSDATTDISLVSDDDWKEAQRRFDTIRPLLAIENQKKIADVKAEAKRCGVHYVTLYRWIKRYQSMGTISSLVPTKKDGGRGKSRLSPEVDTIIKATLEDYYLTGQRRSVQNACDEVVRRCHNAQLDPPHPNTVRYRIAMISNSVKIKARYGSRTAQETYSPAVGSFPGADFPLSVVQMDHTKLDIILVDDVHRHPVGRPWITLAMDVFSRMVVGLYVSFDPPGALSTGLCVAHAILPKEKWLTRYDIATSWPCWGLMKTIHLDNGKEFHGTMLKRACEQYGINIDWRPVATPHYGGHIERILGTFLKEIHTLPGTTFSNTKDRKGYDSENKAVFTLSEFEKWLATYIVEVYHQRLHSAIRTTPIKKYEEGVFGSKDRPGTGLPSRIVDEERLRLDFMPYVERSVQRYGVAIDEIHYYSDVLRPFINATIPGKPAFKQKFIFKRDPRDISQIYFFNPEQKQYSAITYRDPSRPPMSIWELREVTRELKNHGKSQVNEELIFDAYDRMQEQERKAIRGNQATAKSNATQSVASKNTQASETGIFETSHDSDRRYHPLR